MWCACWFLVSNLRRLAASWPLESTCKKDVLID